jgi:hypothetical protein
MSVLQLLRLLFINPVLLSYGKEVVDQPVKNKAGREVDKHKRENDGKKHHNFRLGRITRGTESSFAE